jgi:hypothetical protein
MYGTLEFYSADPPLQHPNGAFNSDYHRQESFDAGFVRGLRVEVETKRAGSTTARLALKIRWLRAADQAMDGVGRRIEG